jgi:hypothetical protein
VPTQRTNGVQADERYQRSSKDHSTFMPNVVMSWAEASFLSTCFSAMLGTGLSFDLRSVHLMSLWCGKPNLAAQLRKKQTLVVERLQGGGWLVVSDYIARSR